MPVTLVTGQKAVGTSGTGSSANVALTNNPTQGNLVCVAIIAVAAGKVLNTVQDANSNSYIITPLSPSSAFDSTAGSMWLAWIIAPSNASKTITATWNGSVTFGQVGCAEFQGATFVFDKDQVGSGNGSTTTLPIVTPLIPNSFIFCAGCFQNAGTTLGSPWTTLNMPWATSNAGDGYVTDRTAAVTVNFSQNISGNWDTIAMMFTTTDRGGDIVIF